MNDEKTLYILKRIIFGIIIFIGLVFMFALGIWVGEERAQFSFAWAENYHMNFGGPKQGFFGNFPMMDYTNSHGVFGEIISINANALIVNDEDNVEKTIIVSDATTIIEGGIKVKTSDLQIGESVVVIGDPNGQGQIEAKLIRILPASTTTFYYLYQNNL